MYKLAARQRLESDLVAVANGQKSKQQVYDVHLKHFRKKFQLVIE